MLDGAAAAGLPLARARTARLPARGPPAPELRRARAAAHRRASSSSRCTSPARLDGRARRRRGAPPPRVAAARRALPRDHRRRDARARRDRRARRRAAPRLGGRGCAALRRGGRRGRRRRPRRRGPRPVVHPHAGTYVEFADEIERAALRDRGPVPRHRATAPTPASTRWRSTAACAAASRTCTSRTSTRDAPSRADFWASVRGRAPSARSARAASTSPALLARARRATASTAGRWSSRTATPRRRRPGGRPRRQPDVPRGLGCARRRRAVRARSASPPRRRSCASSPVQHSERDGERRRAIPAMFGIFGHGNVCGLGPGARRARRASCRSTSPSTSRRWCTPRSATPRRSGGWRRSPAPPRSAPARRTSSPARRPRPTNRLPVLLLPGDTFATRRQGPVLQQLQHPSDARLDASTTTLRPVSRFFDRIARPEQLLDRAAGGDARAARPGRDRRGDARAAPGRPGRGRTTSRAAFFAPRDWRVARRPPDAARSWQRAAALLRAARRPLIVAGGGVRYSAAEAALAALAERCGIPVAETSAGKGASRRGDARARRPRRQRHRRGERDRGATPTWCSASARG